VSFIATKKAEQKASTMGYFIFSTALSYREEFTVATHELWPWPLFRPILFSAGYGNPAYTHVHMHRNVGRVSYATQSMAETMTKARTFILVEHIET
jgi:hypothetical protein